MDQILIDQINATGKGARVIEGGGGHELAKVEIRTACAKATAVWAAKEAMANTERYPGAGDDPRKCANSMMPSGVWADGTILMALAQKLQVELRVWANGNRAKSGEPVEMKHQLYVLRPKPKAGRRAKS